MMKKTIILLLSCLIMLTSFPLQGGFNWIIKAVELVHHFRHHTQCQEENIGLYTFIYIHYLNTEHHHHHYPAQHENLPVCHSHKNTKTTLNVLKIIAQCTIILSIQFQVQQKLGYAQGDFREQQNYYYKKIISYKHNSNIWKPPQLEV